MSCSTAPATAFRSPAGPPPREEPPVCGREGKPIKENLEREHVDIEEVQMAAREHGIADVTKVAAAVLEIDGSISIIPKEGGGYHRTRRHFRQVGRRT